MNKPTATVTVSCIILMTFCEGELSRVSCFGDDVTGATSYASACSEDGDGTYSYSVKRLHGHRAARVLRLADDCDALLALFA